MKDKRQSAADYMRTEREKRVSDTQNAFAEWSDGCDQHEKLKRLVVEKRLASFQATEDLIELVQLVDDPTDPLSSKAMRIAGDRAEVIRKDEREAVSRLKMGYKGGNTMQEAAAGKNQPLRDAAIERWKKKPGYSVNAVALYLMDEGVTTLKKRRVTEIIKDLKPTKQQ